MRVSVVIPAYNEEENIGPCLEALVNQNVPADEIIVVDNNSTDRTAEIAKEYPVKVINESKKGITPARNAGFDAAISDIIARTDADTIVPENWVERIQLNFDQEDIDALSGPLQYKELVVKHFSIVTLAILTRMFTGVFPIFGANCAIKREMWKQIRDKLCDDDTRCHEDFDLALTIAHVKGIVHFDFRLIVTTSARRMKNMPLSFFIEYPVRAIKTIAIKRD